MKLKTMFYRTSKLFRNETTCHISRNVTLKKNAWLSDVDKNSSIHQKPQNSEDIYIIRSRIVEN